MEHEFWHDRWREGRIGFHEAEGNALIARHFQTLNVPDGGRVFIPLSGKTRDIGRLLAQGYRVAAAELSEIAVRELFVDLGASPDIAHLGPLQHWSAPGLDVYVGDVFDLDAGTLGAVDAVLDRAALVALPESMRARYATHLAQITAAAPTLLITFEYPSGALVGPPFSLSETEISRLYSMKYAVNVLEVIEFDLKGTVPAVERAMLLLPV